MRKKIFNNIVAKIIFANSLVFLCAVFGTVGAEAYAKVSEKHYENKLRSSTVQNKYTVGSTILSGKGGANVVWELIQLENGYKINISGTGDMYDDIFDSSIGRASEEVTTVSVGEGITSIGKETFRSFLKLKNISLPASLVSIKDDAFGHCFSLEEITLPVNLRSIGNRAFIRCEALQQVVFPDNVEKIGEAAFQSCSSLSKIVLPKKLKKLDTLVFSICNSLSEVIIPDNVAEFGRGAFEDCKNLKKVYIPGSIKKIGNETFAFCDKLKDVTIGEGVTEIGFCAFAECKSMEGVSLPKSMEKITDDAFRCCPLLKKFIVPDNVSELGPRVFYECRSISDITIGSNVKKIGSKVFKGCTNLKSVRIKSKKLKTMSADAFEDCKKVAIYGYSNSYVEKYAKKYKIKFIRIGKLSQTSKSKTKSKKWFKQPKTNSRGKIFKIKGNMIYFRKVFGNDEATYGRLQKAKLTKKTKYYICGGAGYRVKQTNKKKAMAHIKKHFKKNYNYYKISKGKVKIFIYNVENYAG